MPATTSSEPTAPACEPGRDGIPDSLPGRVLCGDYGTTLDPTAIWQHITAYAPVVFAALAALAVARVGWHTLRMLSWWHPKHPPRWLQITPPVTATPTNTLLLWHHMATLLPAARPWQEVPAHLVWEVHATGQAMRCGIWVPPGISTIAVGQKITDAWPGARITEAPPPLLPQTGHVAARRLAGKHPDWMPLLDPALLPALTGRATPEFDLARGVYSALAAAGRVRDGLLQVIITRATRRRDAILRKAASDPARAGRVATPAALRLLLLVLRGVAAVIRAGFNLFDSETGTHRHHMRPRRDEDPDLDVQRGHARARLAAGPHFALTVRTAAAGSTRSAARAAADAIAHGYGPLGTELRTRRVPLPRLLLATRWAPRSHYQLATAAEAAALTALPAEPSLHGLPAAAAKTRPPAGGTWTASNPPPDLPLTGSETP